MLPTPARLAPVHPRYSSWYPGQDHAFSQIMDWMASESRFLCIEAPTGSGKSLLAMLTALVSTRRTVILTATKGLQAQLLADFGEHLADIRGQNSYPCLIGDGNLTVDHGACHAGVPCPHQFPVDDTPQCTYYQSLREAQKWPAVSTNYAYWMAQGNYSQGLGDRGLLICDEAHMAFQALESHKAVTLMPAEVESLGGVWPDAPLPDWEMWRMWAVNARDRVQHQLEILKEQVQRMGTGADAPLLRKLKSARGVEGKLTTLVDSRGEWAWQRTRGWSFTPIWPAEYASELFLDVPKVVLMSAFMTPKVAELLGVKDATWIRVPSGFPAANTPIKHIPTVRVNRHSTPDHMDVWAARVDQIVDRRQDRKGIVFTVSYDRRSLLYKLTRHRRLMFSHGSDNVVEQVEVFKQATPPAVFVSPTVTSGWDFPGKACEYIVIGKVPYPDTRPAVVKRRHELDPEWTSFMAMQVIVQEAGRGTRSEQDKCEVLIIDDTWVWWWPRYKKFAPQYFIDRVLPSAKYVEDPPW